eukprot:6175264-Amphidinium_carterae.1
MLAASLPFLTGARGAGGLAVSSLLAFWPAPRTSVSEIHGNSIAAVLWNTMWEKTPPMKHLKKIVASTLQSQQSQQGVAMTLSRPLAPVKRCQRCESTVDLHPLGCCKADWKI